jgi:hypothetical protein
MSTPTRARVELIWLPTSAPARTEPRLRIHPGAGPSVSETEAVPVEFALSVCAGPRCGCISIQLKPQPAEDTIAPRPNPFPDDPWLDLATKSLARDSATSKGEAFERLDEIVRTGLTDAQRDDLREWFMAEKWEVIHTTLLDQIEIDDLPDARFGKMIGFVDVFPCGFGFNFRFEGERWTVDDQHCVQTKCACSQTVLSFLKLVDRAGVRAKSIQHPPSLRYDYRTHQIEVLPDWPDGEPSPADLLRAVKAAIPGFDDHLRHHQLMLQSLYAREALRSQIVRQRSLMDLLRPKIGRNEPCPCGSGRKYKHCCMNGPSTPAKRSEGPV